jgi:hypothetical protein
MTWSSSATGLDSDFISLACDANGVLYAAAQSTEPYFLGITTPLRSDDGGASWSSIGGWDPNASSFPFFVTALAVDMTGGNLYAGTQRGVWELGQTPLRIQRP